MKTFLTLILVLCACFSTYAQTSVNPNEPIKFKPKNPRPTDVGEENKVWCTYTNGQITITFEQAEGRATMTITRTEDATTATTAFYTMTPYTYYIGTAPATYIINVRTNRQEYEGLLDIQ